jgi:hypothetical protein
LQATQTGVAFLQGIESKRKATAQTFETARAHNADKLSKKREKQKAHPKVKRTRAFPLETARASES